MPSYDHTEEACEDRFMSGLGTPRPTSIRLFLADGTPEGFRMIEKSGWTGLGLVSARSDYAVARAREEWARPGVYVLTGPPGPDGHRDRVYVGEADDVRGRVDEHVRKKDFWTSGIAFTSKDNSLNKAHVRYLEAGLLRLAAAADRVDMENSTAPPLPPMSEPDRADAEGFLAEMLPVFPLVNVMAFDRVEGTSVAAQHLTVQGPEAQATGADAAEGFIVFQDSLARAQGVPSMSANLQALRDLLLQQGVLRPTGAQLRFTKPWVFDSPSTAAGAVLGRSANGRTEWKTAGGKTLKQVQEDALTQPVVPPGVPSPSP